MKLYVCPICGNVITMISGDIQHIRCCNVMMEEIVPNSSDASAEKHMPVYEVKDDMVYVSVGEILHPMVDDHYISKIIMENGNEVTMVNLKPGEEPKAVFTYVKGAKVYAYCNNHGLWCKEIN